MIPLVPAISLAIVSIIISTIVVLWISRPIWLNRPQDRRGRSLRSSLPHSRMISIADQSHMWLATCDVVALAFFVWQVVYEHSSASSGYDATHNPPSAAGFWISLTFRQTCFFAVMAITLIHVRAGRSMPLGSLHWKLWLPTVLLVAIPTIIAAALSARAIPNFFIGLFTYSIALAVISTAAFGVLVRTLLTIHRNMLALDDIRNPWPLERDTKRIKPFHSMATYDPDATLQGNSWFTSHANLRPPSITSFNNSAAILELPLPSVPTPLHSRPNPPADITPFGSLDPFRRHVRRTEPSAREPTVAAWSFTNEHYESPQAAITVQSRKSLTAAPSTTAVGSVQLLGGYDHDVEKNFDKNVSLSANDLHISIYNIIGWIATIWIPLILSLPYLASAAFTDRNATLSTAILLILSVTLSSPLLGLHILLRLPLPIPSSLFSTFGESSATAAQKSSSNSMSSKSEKDGYMREHQRSCSATLVGGRQSSDMLASKSTGRSMQKVTEPTSNFREAAHDRHANDDTRSQGDLGLMSPLPSSAGNEPMITTTRAVPQPRNNLNLDPQSTRIKSSTSSYLSDKSLIAPLASQIVTAHRQYRTPAKTLVLSPLLEDHPPHFNGDPAACSPDQSSRRSQPSMPREEDRFQISPPAASSLSRPTATSSSSSSSSSSSPPAASSSSPPPAASSLSHPPPSFKTPVRRPRTYALSRNRSWSQSVVLLDLELLQRELSLDTPSSLGRNVGKGKEKDTELGGLSSEFSSPEFHSTPVMRGSGSQDWRQPSQGGYNFNGNLPDRLVRVGSYGSATASNRSEVTKPTTPSSDSGLENVSMCQSEDYQADFSNESDHEFDHLRYLHGLVNRALGSWSTAHGIHRYAVTARPSSPAESESTLFGFANGEGHQAESTPPSNQKSRLTAPPRQATGPSPRNGIRGNRRSDIARTSADENIFPSSIPTPISPRPSSHCSLRAVHRLKLSPSHHRAEQRDEVVPTSDGHNPGSERTVEAAHSFKPLRGRNLNLYAADAQNTTHASGTPHEYVSHIPKARVSRPFRVDYQYTTNPNRGDSSR